MSIPEETVDPPVDVPTPRTPPSRTGVWRPLLLRLHFYAGVLVAPFILVAAISGALYAMAPTLEKVVYGDLLYVERGDHVLPLSVQARAAGEAYPQLEMSGLRPAASATDSTRVYFADPDLAEEKLRAVFVDPYTGRVLGTEPTWLGYLPLSTWLDGLHRHLNLGEPGRIYSELAASWLAVITLGGLWLWVVKRADDRRRGRPGGLLTMDRTLRGRSRTLNRHGVIGVCILTMALFLSATGITWSTYAGAHVTDIRRALNWQRPQLDTSLTAIGGHAAHAGHADPAPADAGPVAVDAVIEAAGRAGVHDPLEVTMPRGPGDAVGVTEIDKPYRLTTDAAAVDPATMTVVAAVDYRRDYSLVAKLADWGIRMHMGFLFGLLNQVLLLVVAAALATTIVFAYRMWWQRRPTRGSQWALGRPPRRGAARRLPTVTVLAVALVSVGVGWFLPSVGVTLAGFLVVDAVIGAVKRRRATPGDS